MTGDSDTFIFKTDLDNDAETVAASHRRIQPVTVTIRLDHNVPHDDSGHGGWIDILDIQGPLPPKNATATEVPELAFDSGAGILDPFDLG